MSNEQILNILSRHASLDGSRSTTLAPMGWAMAFLLPSIITGSYLKVDAWITMMLSIAFVCATLIYLGAYIYFMFTDTDCLRSEKFSLTKMEMQHNLTGDSQKGLLDTVSPSSTPVEIQGTVHE